MNTRTEIVHNDQAVFELATIIHEGHEFTSGGAYLSDGYAIGYLSSDGKHITTWSGEIMGPANITASWEINSYLSDRMYQVYARIDGILYTGRSLGKGMLWRGKRVSNQ